MSLWRTVKYEDIYLRDYGSVAELDAGWREISAATTTNGRTNRSAPARQRQCTGWSTFDHQSNLWICG